MNKSKKVQVLRIRDGLHIVGNGKIVMPDGNGMCVAGFCSALGIKKDHESFPKVGEYPKTYTIYKTNPKKKDALKVGASHTMELSILERRYLFGNGNYRSDFWVRLA
jgi:hypothetical protein